MEIYGKTAVFPGGYGRIGEILHGLKAIYAGFMGLRTIWPTSWEKMTSRFFTLKVSIVISVK